ncbi:AAA-domain-containing protein [Tothia fuscella]|uniref:AAA-domain-containing protein n=1 Tax=Tothia fuscella TaxID=1048955 RepID=A0A9P4NNZ5_9PEZI|nr:AAA-domain-containing protein [Tothia fuscella]
MEALKSKCNKYEQQLLSGVVHPENIKIGFDDVHVSPDTIDALKTMTSLSFTRPDAFQYGILKSDSLPGLLMYGPPGTGKTMLAKAVASSTSTTVLTISGSEIRQMYVGESEKIIKAVFTLAQKLTPCIVFIDEADSLLGTRAVSETGNTTRRDTINQFLLEWDGLNESSVFLMVATNRPFDLDDAVLRRLPRRLLVDLPTKDDRAAILGLHLRGEILDPTVDIAILATSTPFYSGSDLKNVVVSTALAAVKEENEIATQAITGGDAGYKYPDRRILTQRHFEKALEEIAASVGEDMVSLSAMRKWDERYGDRKGRRKRSGWGNKFSETQTERPNMKSIYPSRQELQLYMLKGTPL